MSTYFRNSNVKLKNTQLQLMKRFSFRTILLLGGIFICLSMANSCQEPLPEEPGIVLSSDEVQVSADGGQIELPYELTGFDGLPDIKAVYDAEWIDGFDFSEEGVIRFDVQPTDSREQRNASVRVVVPGFGVESSFNIVQYEGEIPDLAITTYGLVENRIYYNVTPFDKDMTYIVLGCEKSRVADFTTDEQWYEADDEYFKLLMQYYGLPYKDVLAMLIRSGNMRDEAFYNLTPDTDYCIYAYGMTAEGEPTTSITKEYYKTPELIMTDPNFEFNVDVDGYKVNVEVVPESDDIYYLCDVVDPSIVSDADALVEMLQTNLDDMILRWETNTWVTTEAAVDTLCERGVYKRSLELEPEKEYVVYTLSVSPVGLINSDLKTHSFTTEGVQQSDNVLTVKVSDIKSNMATAEITASNDDPYVYIACKNADFEGMDDKQILDKLTSNEYSAQLRKGRKSASNPLFNLTPDTEYRLFVFGYEYNTVTTDLAQVSFRTLSE